jgi:cytochrome c
MSAVMRLQVRLCLALVITVTGPTVGIAADPAPQRLPPLAAKQHCDECHAIQETRIGPPFQAVALRYAAEGPVAEERLARKIINGGAGNWGNIPMVANERVSLDDARAIAHWILSLASPSAR